jgi:hypothetical protein
LVEILRIPIPNNNLICSAPPPIQIRYSAVPVLCSRRNLRNNNSEYQVVLLIIEY